MLSPIKRLASLGLISLIASSIHASGFPRGCEASGFNFSDNYLILNQAGRQTFFLMQNRSNQSIQLERHETHDVFMSPEMEANLAPGSWAAFASDEQNLHFQCSIKKDESKTDRVDCSAVLDICQYPRARFALSNMGNYWVSTNRPQNLVIKEAVAKGIYLKW